jgi:succinyl-CoA synthetase beta subunit
LNQHQIPCLEFPENVADVLQAMSVKEGRFESGAVSEYERGNPLVEGGSANRRHARPLMQSRYETGYLRSDAAMKLLELYGISTPRWQWITAPGMLEMEGMNFPVVAKIEHPEVLHKSDAGGVVLNIESEAALRQVVEELFNAFPGAEAVLVQEQAKITHELILGGKFEPGIGHLCVVGAGGTLVELFQDVSVKLMPVCQKQASGMIESLKTYPLLNGYRGKAKVPVEELAEVVKRFSDMVGELPGIQEIDLNPVTWDASSGQFMAVDCRIRVENNKIIKEWKRMDKMRNKTIK